MITGDDSRHRAAMLLADPPNSEQLLRVPVRITAPGGRVIDGHGALDTGCSTSVVDDSLGLPISSTDAAVCGCGNTIPVPRVEAVLSVAGVQVEGPFARSMKGMDMVALIGLDILQQCEFSYANGRFTLEGK